MKVLISGGHLTPALALIDYAQTLPAKDEFVFVGRNFSQTELKQQSQEKEEVSRRGVAFVEFGAGKVPSSFRPLLLVKQGIQFGSSLVRARQILKQEQPDVFLSFGGYLAVPLAIAAFTLGIPIITHEQTRVAGVANQFIARLAKKIAVSYPDSLTLFSQNKTILTGNPLRSKIIETRGKVPSWLKQSPTKPMLYITGGNQGSQIINVMVAQVLSELTKDWFVIHQCGNPTVVMDYQKTLERAHYQLSPEQQKNYVVREWLTENELAWVYRKTSLVVSRAGANTIQELMALAKPAILIPLLHAPQDEQSKNAEVMASVGSAIILPQKDLTPQSLLASITRAKKKLGSLNLHAEVAQSTVKLDGDKELYNLVRLSVA